MVRNVAHKENQQAFINVASNVKREM